MIKYFVFSMEQLKMKKTISEKMSQQYVPGSVFVGNRTKDFTDIVDNPIMAKFSDTIIVASGELSDIKYKLGSD